ncbi:fatty acid desaturase [Trinickia symbiotica]|uniref:Fatty acid desaturase n=1 Tax=Trinickia symbiotica TaxID=863227 RepID=A0A2T3XRG3_9BURK|nr:fatty acid desaturase [Trinickia symbiotica]PTB19057.1 fatty acid desaturase [Trinickia symbiotica]
MNHHAVMSDQDFIRSSFPEWSAIQKNMTSPDALRVSIDIFFDWLCVALAMLCLHRFGWWSAPVTVVWIGNRQRALGNLLHDAAHRNLARSFQLNDSLARLFIAPALFNSLALYRELHARHHAWLGDPKRDPDYIALHREPGYAWWQPYCRALVMPAAWLSSLFGHLHLLRLSFTKWFGIVAWWTLLLGVMSLVLGLHAATFFLGAWMLARATVFHLITTFRELCDHFGLLPGGIFNYTRDVSSRSLWRWIIHPHNNGYHLTHHLMPSIPYHRLANAQRKLLELPAFVGLAKVCHTYFRGADAVVHEWELSTGGRHDAT